MPPNITTYIIIAIYQLFETISRGGLAADRIYLYLNNAPESSDRYHYRNLLIIWNDLTRGSRNRSHIFQNIFIQSKHYLHIYFSAFVCLIFDVHLMTIKVYFQNIVFWQKVEFLYDNCGRIWTSLKSIIIFISSTFLFCYSIFISNKESKEKKR